MLAWTCSADKGLCPTAMRNPLQALNRRRLLLAGAAACGAAALPGVALWKHRGRIPSIASRTAMADTPATIALGDPKNFDLGAPGAGIDRQPVGMHF